MRNLKRALSLVLAAMMLVGMMVVGASAASFPDSDKIEHTEAVDNMVALGIILGKDNGNFDPEGNVTRAEMAKMICVAMNGGKDPKLTGSAAYGDTTNHWAAGYIQWCTNFGYVSGYNGLFRPDDTVTGTEAAKMLLVALGYNAQKEKYENDAAWATNINVAANLKGLYDELAISPDATLNRDAAAQMVWNACNATMVKYEFQGFVVDGTSITQAVDRYYNSGAEMTILSEKFKVSDTTGMLISYTYDEDENEYTYNVKKDAKSNGTTTYGKMSDTADASYTTEKDFTNLVGQRVKVLVKDNDNNSVFGMFDASGLVVTVTKGDVVASAVAANDTKKKIDGTEYEFNTKASTVNVYYTKTGATANTTLDGLVSAIAGIEEPSTVKLVSYDSNKTIDHVIVTPVKIAKVTYVGSKSITADKGYTFKDNNIADDIKKDDFVTIVADTYSYNGKATVEKAETVSGVISAARSGNEFQIDGSWYKKASTAAGDTVGAGDDVTLVIVGSYYYNTKNNDDTASKDILYVSAGEAATAIRGASTEVYFTDGTTQVVTVTKMDGTKLTSETVAAGLYTYKVKDGKYELTTVAAGNKAGYKGFKSGTNNGYDDKKINSDNIADDAVIFVQTIGANADVKVLSGKQVKAWGDITFAKASNSDKAAYLYDVVNGYDTVKVGSLYAATNDPKIPGAAGDENYGYIVSDKPQAVKEGDDLFVSFQIWNGEETVDVKEQISSSSDVSNAQYAQGKFVTYDDLGNGEVENTTDLSTNFDSYAVTAIDQDAKDIKLRADGKVGTTELDLKLTKDTKVIYVNTDDKEGLSGDGKIPMATETAVADTYVENVFALVDPAKGDADAVDNGDEVLVVFVDLAGLKVKDNNGTKFASTVTPATGTQITSVTDAANGEVTASGSGTQVAAEAAGWTGAIGAKVTSAGTDVTDGNVAAGYTLTVVAEDGTVFAYTIK